MRFVQRIAAGVGFVIECTGESMVHNASVAFDDFGARGVNEFPIGPACPYSRARQ